MAISTKTETNGKTRPILLKGTGQTMCLEVKIGGLGLEVWHFPNEEAHPYARLIFEPGQDGKIDDQAEQGSAELSVTVDWQQACAVSEAVLEWVSNIESDIEDHRVPALHMELAPLTFDFYRHDGGQAPRMICTAETEHGLSRQVILTRSETSLLGRLLVYLGDDEVNDRQD